MLPPKKDATRFGNGQPYTWTNAGYNSQQAPIRTVPSDNGRGGQRPAGSSGQGVAIRPGTQPYTAQPAPRKGG